VDLKLVIEEFQDYLAPTLDVYEQAVYLYIFRHSRLLGQSETTIGFKSARLKITLGKGQEGARMAENTCYEKLRSLEAKGCLRVLGTERGGTRIRLNLPSLRDPESHPSGTTCGGHYFGRDGLLQRSSPSPRDFSTRAREMFLLPSRT
jgi:hypothetical protein